MPQNDSSDVITQSSILNIIDNQLIKVGSPCKNTLDSALQIMSFSS